MEEQPSRHANNAEEQPLPRKVEERLTLQDRGPPYRNGDLDERPSCRKSNVEERPSDEKRPGSGAL